MIPVADAVSRVVAAFAPLESETVDIDKAAGRVLAEDATARLDQPPAPVSAMDGYALRAADATAPVRLRVVGSAPAGNPYMDKLGAGEAVRIFTGGVVPDGADSIIIQEDTTADKDGVTLNVPARPGRHIRVAGLDFRTGDVLLPAGRRLGPRDLALLAAGDFAQVQVRRKPRIAYAATGDELARPGEKHAPGGIVASSGYALAAQIEAWGGVPVDLGILPDRVEAIAAIAATKAELIVTLGGASVGDHDLVQRALGPQGFTLDFWKIAMRPGKPLIFGRLGATPLLGFPGNPVSTFVCALLFLRPAIAALLGTDAPLPLVSAHLEGTLPANDTRQDYVRARLSLRDGEHWVRPYSIQDSSMQKTLAEADALIVRVPHAAAVPAGGRVDIVALAGL